MVDISMAYSWEGAQETVILPLLLELVFLATLLLKCVQDLGPLSLLHSHNHHLLCGHTYGGWGW